MAAAHPDRWANAEQLYEQLMPDAVHLAYLLCGDRATAEDAAQDAFINLMAKPTRLQQVENIRAFLHRCVVRQVANNRRSWRRWLRRTENFQTNQGDTHHDRDVGQQLELTEALATLPEKHRTVIALSYLCDYDDQSIAQITGWSRTSIRSTRYRALDKLRKELNHDCTL